MLSLQQCNNATISFLGSHVTDGFPVGKVPCLDYLGAAVRETWAAEPVVTLGSLLTHCLSQQCQPNANEASAMQDELSPTKELASNPMR